MKPLLLLLALLCAQTLSAQIVINEIMFHPAHAEGSAEPTAEEYIELLNTSGQSVSLAGWQFDRGISYSFASETIPAGQVLVVAADLATFQATHPGVTNVVGGWTGQLSNSGERIRLIDSTDLTIDSVEYSDQGDWAQRVREVDGGENGWTWNSPADSGGSALELRNPSLSNQAGQNWTPGSSSGITNNAASSNIAPLIRNVEHSPAVPRSTDTVQIEADIDDEDLAGETVTLHWRISRPGTQDSFTASPMADNNANGRWEADIPPHPNGTVVEFYVSASDGTNTRTWPAPTDQGQIANCLYQVDEETIAATGASYRLVMSLPENDQFTAINRSSNAQMNTTLIADDGSGPSIRYLCGNRVRGAGSRQRNPVSHRINIPRDNSWNGLTRMNLNTQYAWLQFIGMKLHHASGIAAPETRRVQVRRNGQNFADGAVTNYGSYVHVEPLGGEFLDNQLPDDSAGNMYKKVRPDEDMAYRSTDVAAYLDDGWSKSTNSSEADWSDLDEFLRVMNQATGDANYIAQVEAVADLDQWMDWFAAMTLLANGETNPSSGTDDDYSIYSSGIDGRFIFLPHDLDTILGLGDNSAITDPTETLFDMIERNDILDPLVPLFNNTNIRTRYLQSLRKLSQTSFSKTRFDELLTNHLEGWVPQTQIDGMVNWMDQRRAFVTAEVDAVLGAPPSPTSPSTTATLISAPGQVMLHEILAAGTPDAVEIYNAGPGTADIGGMTISDDPISPALFTIPSGTLLNAGTYRSFTADQLGFTIDTDGETLTLYNSNGTTADSVSFGLQIPGYSIGRTGFNRNIWALMPPTIGTANATPSSIGNVAGLKINEWLAQPEIRFKRDYLELFNPSAQPIALGGLTIADQRDQSQLPTLSYIAPAGFSVFHPVGSDAIPGEWDELPFGLSLDLEWITISGENGVQIDQVHVLNQRPDIAQGRSPDGSGNYARFNFATPGLPNPQQDTTTSTLVAWGADWKYDDTDTDLGTAWRDPSFDDTSWPSGPGALGVENATLPIAIQTPLDLNPPSTHYFRYTFNFNGDPANTTLNLQLLVDDGAITYLNGTEISRLRLPAQTDHFTLTNDFVQDADVEGPFAIPDGLLQVGSNTLAVEVHQSAADSSDVVFAAHLEASQTTSQNPAYLAAQQLLDGLRITEIMYNPAGAVDDQQEYIEFQNIGTVPLQLGGVKINEGVAFEFPTMALAPGAYTLAVASTSGFQAAYGNTLPIAGEFTGRLANSGEPIQLQLPVPYEANILCFEYNDNWYPTTDGDGHSLTMVDPLAPISLWDKSRGWLPSSITGGTPGSIGPPIVTSQTNASGTQGAPFQYQITAANAPTSFGATPLPSGLSINPTTGTILGTPTVFGNFTVNLAATNPGGTGNETLTLTLAAQPPPQINSPLEISALAGEPFSYQITASNFPTNFDASSLPTWLTFDPPSGILSGTPQVAGSVSLTISATNASGTDTETLQIQVDTDPFSIALDTRGIEWFTGGDTEWTTTTTVSHDGVDSATTGPNTDRQDTYLAIIVDGPDTLTFWWSLTNPPDAHRSTLGFFVDDEQQFRIRSGFGQPAVDWEQRTYEIPVGRHTIAWSLNTRAFGSGGIAYLDEVTLASQQITSDTDADGLPDDWEIQHFGNLAQGPDDDPDADGSTNAQEFAARTSPTDPTDHFRITDIQPFTPGTAALTWSSSPGVTYQIQTSADLTSWADVGTPILGVADDTTAVTQSPGISLFDTQLVGQNAAARAFVPTTDIGTNWRSDITYNDSTWLSGSSGVGYETGNGGYENFFGIDVEPQMLGARTSVYLRIPFQVTIDPAAVTALTLRMRYDDGFAAFLNGTQVASANAPTTLDHNSSATDGHNDAQAVELLDFDITEHRNALLPGSNILAIHGFNDQNSSSDLLLEPTLETTFSSGSPDAGYWRVVIPTTP